MIIQAYIIYIYMNIYTTWHWTWRNLAQPSETERDRNILLWLELIDVCHKWTNAMRILCNYSQRERTRARGSGAAKGTEATKAAAVVIASDKLWEKKNTCEIREKILTDVSLRLSQTQRRMWMWIWECEWMCVCEWIAQTIIRNSKLHLA